MLHAELLESITGLVHGFTDRLEQTFTPDPADTAWAQLAGAVQMAPEGIALVRQVHGCAVRAVVSPGMQGDADAMITRQRGVLLGIRTADCVPILLCCSDGQIAAVHSGWRGTALDIVGKTIAAMGTVPSAAVIGPCISAAHYEVGEEVVEGIASSGVPANVFASREEGQRPHVDLRAAVRWQLHRQGVTAVETLPQCSFGQPNLHSHRRDRQDSGRMAAFIGWRP